MHHHRHLSGRCGSAAAVLTIIDGRPWTARRIHPNSLRQHCHVIARTFRGPHPLTDPLRPAFRRLLETIANDSDLLISTHPSRFPLIPVLVRIAAYHHHWIRAPESWRMNPSASPRAGIRSLAEHLFARSPVPACFDSAWYVKGSLQWLERDWYCLLAGGGSIRKAAGVPRSLNSRALHLALHDAPGDLGIRQALRWGQVKAFGGSDAVLDAVLASKMVGDLSNDAIWSRLIEKAIATCGFDPGHFGIIADTLLEVLAKEDGLRRAETLIALPLDELLQYCRSYWNAMMKSLLADFPKRRTADIHLAQTRLELRIHHSSQWQPLSGCKPYRTALSKGGSVVRCQIVELLKSWQLVAESHAMKHCVDSYAHDCKQGWSSIFSVRTEEMEGGQQVLRSQLTVQVHRESRRIVQIRGRRNAPCSPAAIALLSKWARQMELVMG